MKVFWSLYVCLGLKTWSSTSGDSLKEKIFVGRKCCESRESLCETSKEKVDGIKYCERKSKCCWNLNKRTVGTIKIWFKYFLFSFISNNNLMRTNLLFKSSVDGDILQVFWITRNLESLRKKTFFLQKRSKSWD